MIATPRRLVVAGFLSLLASAMPIWSASSVYNATDWYVVVSWAATGCADVKSFEKCHVDESVGRVGDVADDGCYSAVLPPGGVEAFEFPAAALDLRVQARRSTGGYLICEKAPSVSGDDLSRCAVQYADEDAIGLECGFGLPEFEQLLAEPRAYIQEFLTAAETKLTEKGWAPRERVIPDPDLLRGLRAESGAGSIIRAVAIVNTGVHPRWTLVFLEEDAGVSVIGTYTFWGEVHEKLGSRMSSREFSEVLEDLKEGLMCSRYPSPRYGLWLRALAYWEDETLFVCPAFTREGPRFSSRIEQILDEATVTYSLPEARGEQ